MPRPPRDDEAKSVLIAYYGEMGSMPSIEKFAQMMGYSSVASAHLLASRLTLAGFLAKDTTGHLRPGPTFVRVKDASGIPVELHDSLPANVPLRVVVASDDFDAEHGIRAGDLLVLAPTENTELGSQFLATRGRHQQLVQSDDIRGWRIEGVLVAQFRSYLR